MYQVRLRHLAYIFLIALFLGLTATDSDAQVLVGGRGGAYFADGDPFIGGEVLVGVADNLWFNPNVEWIFVENANKATFNFDVHYDFARRGPAMFWFGGGLAVIYVDPDGAPDSNTDAGANLLFGVGFRTAGRRWVPYVQAKVLAADDSDFSVGFGVRF